MQTDRFRAQPSSTGEGEFRQAVESYILTAVFLTPRSLALLFYPLVLACVGIAQAALECLLDEKAELARHAAELETRLRETEASAAAAAAASRTTLLPSEESGTPEPGQEARAGETADHERGGDGNAVGTPSANTGGQSPEGAERAAVEQAAQQHRQRHQELLLRQAEIEIDASRSTTEADCLRGELENARTEQAQAAAAAAEEREASATRVSKLEAAVEQTKREYREHRDRAESRLETLRVAFDQENEENDPQACMWKGEN